MRFIENNKKIINSILLGLYFLFLSSAVFHSHNIDLNSFANFQDYNSSSKFADPFLDSNLNCALAHFLQTQFSQSSNDFYSYITLPANKNYSPDYFIFKLSSSFLNSIQLRAPPTMFS